MADQKIVTETALSAFASDVKGELISKIGYDELPTISDNEPYNFRPSGNGKGIGNRETDKIIGGTVAWNQFYSGTDSQTVNGITFTVNSDETITVNGTATADAYYALSYTFGLYKDVGHKFFLSACPKDASPNTYFALIRFIGVEYDLGNGFIFNVPNTQYSGAFSICVKSGTTINNLVFKPQIIDLTQMFGSTIADYIYNLEQGTAGAGVAYFRKLFPKPYYAYNAGELMSVKTSAHKMVGFNQWDEQWELGSINGSTGEPFAQNTTIRCKNFIPVKPDTSYYYYCGVSGLQFRICYYDKTKTFISSLSATNINSAYTTPSNCCYVKFAMRDTYGTTYNNDICINISNSKNGTYEPYEVNEYPLDSDLELRGIPKLDANNNLYYDGDEYTSDGNVNRRYAIVDLGSLSWDTNVANRSISSGLAGIIKAPTASTLLCGTLASEKYREFPSNSTLTTDGQFAVLSNGNLVFYRDTDTPTGFLLYPLATPTSETADAYQNPQICDGYGTEEYVDERAVAIPVGHETEYVKNMDRLLLPATPSADGTYTLKCTVSGGTPTLSWVADT